MATPGERSALPYDENDERLRLAIDATGVGMFDFEPQTGRLVWSEHTRRHFGLSPGAPVDYDVFLRGLHPADRARVVDIVERVLRADSDGEYATEYRTVGLEDGRERWLSARGRVTFDAQRRPVRLIGVTVDITERKRAEQALRAERDFTAAVLDIAASLVVVLDRRGRVVRFNAACEAATGYRESEVLGRSYAMFVPEEERASVRDVFERLTMGDFPGRYENHWVARDGSQRLIAWSNTALPDDAGRPRWIVATGVDVTEQRRAESAVRESEERFRHLANAMPQLAWTAGPDGRVDYYNERVAAYYGFSRGVDGTWHWEPSLHPDDREPTAAAWSRALRTGRPYEIEHRVRLADGSYAWHLSRGVPVRDAQGRVVRWYGTATDIDAQKHTEDALREADRRKDEFLGMLSHELRNPLAPIWNSLYIMEHTDPAGERARHAREVVTRQVGHMTRLVDDLLDITRIARGKVELQRRELDLAQLAERACNDYRALMEQRGITLGCPEGGPLYVHGDETRLGQVVGNLLHNAAKFTPAGGRVAIEIAADDGTAVLRVHDTGGGIRPELLPLLFEPFTQAHQGLARAEGGLGLGLALVKGLVELHGGNVDAESAGPGCGATFTVRLPLARPREVERVA